MILCTRLSSLWPSPYPHGGGAQGAVLRVLPHRTALPGHRRHHDRERQLWSHGRQDLRLGPCPDGEHAMLPARCIQDHVTQVGLCMFLMSLELHRVSSPRDKLVQGQGGVTCSLFVQKRRQMSLSPRDPRRCAASAVHLLVIQLKYQC